MYSFTLIHMNKIIYRSICSVLNCEQGMRGTFNTVINISKTVNSLKMCNCTLIKLKLKCSVSKRIKLFFFKFYPSVNCFLHVCILFIYYLKEKRRLLFLYVYFN